MNHFLKGMGVLALGVAAAASHALVWTGALSPTINLSTTATTTALNTAGFSGAVRAYSVTGNWAQVAGNPFSNEFRSQIAGVTTLGGGTLDRAMGGLGTNANFVFQEPGVSTWNNNTTTAPAGHGMLTHLANGALSLGGSINLGLRQTFSGSTATLTNGRVSFYTDVIAPVAINTTGGPTMTGRPNSLTGTNTGTWNYQAVTFTPTVTGAYHIGLYTGGVDAMLFGYNGAFNPTSTLTNLIGIDDAGDLGDANSSGMWLNLVSGQQYTFVATHFTAGSNVSNGLLTIAGGAAVPEPGTMAALGLGAAALLRRRRNRK
jgi:hypothetical protein